MNVELWITILSSLVGLLIGSQFVVVVQLGNLARRVDELEGRTTTREQPVTLDTDVQRELRKLQSGPVGMAWGEEYPDHGAHHGANGP